MDKDGSRRRARWILFLEHFVYLPICISYLSVEWSLAALFIKSSQTGVPICKRKKNVIIVLDLFLQFSDHSVDHYIKIKALIFI